MAKTSEHQQRTDAERIPATGSGKLDSHATGSAPRRRTQRGGRRASPEQTREHLLSERRAAMEELARLTRAAEREAPGGTGETPCEECGLAIVPARLAAMPEVAVCRDCQERRERRERAA